ncbi:uncharacterized protein A1O9_12765 [Exophiala aquamarina CBS 119918]|uniref:Voltage-gated hydrogen channel 1 n=1 Tax=Exophiala aquamarina CBS 119918 TaxID=1182545 RepID=A0A072NU38_9EURO|nr:uncharacterized protein A1O9_12765 [Exophiala aquamarina CBS 119918]KEF51151.1 hypothetical protein A1O9_12765 [Exophiala aquamarina CBS 119918]
MANKVLGSLSLTFSCLFMAELLGSVFAFGLGDLLLLVTSTLKFLVFDATVIVAAFIVDVLLRGPLEEAGSLVVALRLWRVFRIIEEFSSRAEDELAELQERISELQHGKAEVDKGN